LCFFCSFVITFFSSHFFPFDETSIDVGVGPEGTEDHRRPKRFGGRLWAEDGTALVVQV